MESCFLSSLMDAIVREIGQDGGEEERMTRRKEEGMVSREGEEMLRRFIRNSQLFMLTYGGDDAALDVTCRVSHAAHAR